MISTATRGLGTVFIITGSEKASSWYPVLERTNEKTVPKRDTKSVLQGSFGILLLLENVFDFVFEDEDVGRLVSSYPDKILIVIFNPAFNFLAIDQFYGNRGSVADQVREITDLGMGLFFHLRRLEN